MKVCTLLLLRRKGELLLAQKKRGFGAGYWNGAGGKIETGETVEQALVRESIEEIGVTPLTFTKVAEHDFVMDENGAEPWHMHVHAYDCWRWQGTPAESDEMAPRWFKLQDIPYEQMWQDDIMWLPAVLDGKKLRSRFRFDTQNNLLGGQFEIVQEFL